MLLMRQLRARYAICVHTARHERAAPRVRTPSQQRALMANIYHVISTQRASARFASAERRVNVAHARRERRLYRRA